MSIRVAASSMSRINVCERKDKGKLFNYNNRAARPILKEKRILVQLKEIRVSSPIYVVACGRKPSNPTPSIQSQDGINREECWHSPQDTIDLQLVSLNRIHVPQVDLGNRLKRKESLPVKIDCLLGHAEMPGDLRASVVLQCVAENEVDTRISFNCTNILFSFKIGRAARLL